jgi:hypothetical protein
MVWATIGTLLQQCDRASLALTCKTTRHTVHSLVEDLYVRFRYPKDPVDMIKSASLITPRLKCVIICTPYYCQDDHVRKMAQALPPNVDRIVIRECTYNLGSWLSIAHEVNVERPTRLMIELSCVILSDETDVTLLNDRIMNLPAMENRVRVDCIDIGASNSNDIESFNVLFRNIRHVCDVKGVHITFRRIYPHRMIGTPDEGPNPKSLSDFGNVLAAMRYVSVSDETREEIGDMRNQYDIAISHATEVRIDFQYWGIMNPAVFPSTKRLQQVVVTMFYVHRVLTFSSWYNHWRKLLDVMRQHGLLRIVVNLQDDDGIFAKIPTSQVLAKEAHDVGITFVLRGIIRNPLTRACAMRLACSVGVEIEDDIQNDDHNIAKRDVDLDMARLGTPGLNAMWANMK